MAKIDVIMPQMGESIAEGTLSRWIKKVGETIKRDEPIFEISTDKVDAEIPAPTAGSIGRNSGAGRRDRRGANGRGADRDRCLHGRREAQGSRSPVSGRACSSKAGHAVRGTPRAPGARPGDSSEGRIPRQ